MSNLDDLYSGRGRLALLRADGTWPANPDLSNCVVLAGSFNPLHDGHRRLVEVAGKISSRQSVFEISIENVDKPDLPRDELESRLNQFRGYADVAVTRAKLFSDKIELMPGAWFVIGFDTAVRLLDDQYYPDNDAAGDLRRLMRVGVKFVVAGRVDAQEEFKGLESLNVPAGLHGMFISVPESEFREDVSSTELRKQRDH